ncbi:hypothetical protein [Maridesulfovibrio sp.]|uniref:hypothetical protein n=1 Tax=Maridesulfovibrio sp. TaxID=2795000 RepID=UPI002A18AA57|nr:hypothetical protein [Maridesulfovibrio sp.]
MSERYIRFQDFIYGDVKRAIQMNKIYDNVKSNVIDPDLFDLSFCSYSKKESVQRALIDEDFKKVFIEIDEHYRFLFFRNNLMQFMMYDVLTDVFYEWYLSRPKYSYSMDVLIIKYILEHVDRDKLIYKSDSHSYKFPLTVYRGVIGRKDLRDYVSHGYSWTADYDVAIKYSWPTLWPTHRDANCFVYKTVINEDSVYLYTNHKDEKEFVCKVRYDAIEIVHDFSPIL